MFSMWEPLSRVTQLSVIVAAQSICFACRRIHPTGKDHPLIHNNAKTVVNVYRAKRFCTGQNFMTKPRKFSSSSNILILTGFVPV